MKPPLRALLALLCFFPVLVPRAQTITTIAGTPMVYGFSGAGGPATSAKMGELYEIAVDNGGNVYTCDMFQDAIWKINTAGIASLYAGTGVLGYTGDGGPAASAELYHPAFVSADNLGNLYFLDQNGGCLRKVDASGTITTILSNTTTPNPPSGDGGPATAATFNEVDGFVPDNAGNFYVSDYGAGTIRKINSAGIITTIAGTGVLGFSGDGGPATAAQLNAPYRVGLDNAGNIYIPDARNNRVRKIDAAGIITTVAGNGTAGYSGDGGPATNAALHVPWTVVFDASGNMYIDDALNNCVRKVDNTGTITTYAGVGGATNNGYSGDGGPATAAKLNGPNGIALDNGGNLYISDEGNYIVRKVNNCLFAQITQQPAAGTICAGDNATFTLTATGSTGYHWQANSGSGWNDLSDAGVYGGTGTNSLTITSAVASMNTTQYRCSIVNGCGTITTLPAILTVNTTSTPTLTITTPAATVCAGATVNFTANSTNGGTTPTFQWQLNGTDVGTNSTYSNPGLANGDVVSCALTSNSTCATTPDAAATITMTVNPVITPAVSIAGPGAAICAGSPANFTASPTNGGAAPAYQWLVNAQPTSATGATYVNTSLNNGDVVSCVLTTSAGCATAPTTTSNPVPMTVDQLVTPSVSIAGPGATICAGSPASFTASPTNGGAAPAYQWLLNTQPTSATGATYTNTSLSNGDVVSCVLTTSAGCATTPTAISNTITEQVNPVVNAAMRIDASTTSICSGTQVTFTAAPVNSGPTPGYQWQVNGGDVGSGKPVYTTNALADGDIVSCILTSSLPCSAPAVSQNQVVVTVNASPTVLLMADTIIGLGQSVVLEAGVTGPVTGYQWTPAVGLDNAYVAAPVATPQNTTTYQVTVSTDANCMARAKVTIGIFKTLEMPGAFTPNGDGKNDLFRIPPSLAVKISAFAVYDRWGARVFYTSNSAAGWDGTLGGRPQPTGTYVWIIDYQDFLTGKPAQAQGTVLLIR